MNGQFYLVQRLETNKEVDVSKCRFGERFGLDYMGSSEFEWGAFPKFLRSINAGDLQTFSHKVGKDKIFGVFDANKQSLTHVLESIDKIASGKLHLKESAHLTNRPSYVEQVDAWAEIEQNVFWAYKDYRTTIKAMFARSVEYMDGRK